MKLYWLERPEFCDKKTEKIFPSPLLLPIYISIVIIHIERIIMKKLIKLFEENNEEKIYEFVWKNKTKPTLKDLLKKYSKHPIHPTLMYLLKYKEKQWFKYAVQSDNLSLIKFLHSIKKKDNYVFPLTFYAVSNNNLETLTWLHENGYRTDDYVTGKAARLGHLKCLEYLGNEKQPCTKYTFYEAALFGTSECVEYLLEINCEYNSHTFTCAASQGNLTHLQLLYQHNLQKVKTNKLPNLLWDQWAINETKLTIQTLKQEDQPNKEKINNCNQCLDFLCKYGCPQN